MNDEINENMTQEAIDAQWEVCGLYLIFAFKKRGKVVKRYHDNFKNWKI